MVSASLCLSREAACYGSPVVSGANPGEADSTNETEPCSGDLALELRKRSPLRGSSSLSCCYSRGSPGSPWATLGHRFAVGTYRYRMIVWMRSCRMGHIGIRELGSREIAANPGRFLDSDGFPTQSSSLSPPEEGRLAG